MSSSTSSGAALVCLTVLFFIAQACVLDKTQFNTLTPSCCMKVSDAPILERIDACFEQKENAFHLCKMRAYIFTKGDKAWCVDPNAKWLPKRLKILERRGIYCKIL